MSVWLDLTRATGGVNVLLLLGLGYVWGRNYLDIRSKHTLGLLLFSVMLLAENALALYYYFAGLAIPAVAVRAMAFLGTLEFLALALLAWVTWD